MSIVLRPPSVRRLIEYSLTEVEGIPEFKQETRNDRNRMSGHSKVRKIMVPNEPMRKLQSQLREYLRTLPVDYTYATAYRPGCATKLNVERHRKSRYFYLMDLESAFDQVNGIDLAFALTELVRRMAREAVAVFNPPMKLEERPFGSDANDMFVFLKKYCLLPSGNGLPQGGPASQDLFNIYYAVRLDGLVGQYARKHGLVYSRYGDDLTVSSRKPIGKVMRQKLRGIILRNAGELSHHKCEVVDIARVGGQSILINGIRLRYGGMMQAPAHFVRQARAITRAALMSHDEHLYYRAQGLVGCVLYVARGRDLTRTEARLAHEFNELRALREELG